MEVKNFPWRDINARGLTLIQFKRYLIETFSMKETIKTLGLLTPEHRDIVAHAQKSSWYPFEIQRQLREAIIARIDPDDPYGVMFRMGLATASWDFSGFLKPFFSFISKKTILNHSANLWGKYYDRGKMSLIEYSEERCYSCIELVEFSADPHFYPVVTSWMTVALKTLKASNPQVEYSHYVQDGPVMKFELRWDSQPSS